MELQEQSTEKPRRIRILLECVKRLEQISVAGGFLTDAGLSIALGQNVELGENDPDIGIVIVLGDERPTGSQQKACYDLPIMIRALAKEDSDTPALAIEYLIADIKKAIEADDRTLDQAVNRNGSLGLVRDRVSALPREEGSRTVGAEVVYIAPVWEAWGQP